MEILIRLLAVALIPIGLSVICYIITKKTAFQKLNFWLQQGILGVAFGIAAILGTVFGVEVGGATANARDAAPLCAGLLFGAPAGIAAGIIGGVYRWFAAYHGAGMYSQVACAASTVLAGFYAAAIRKFMLEGRRANWVMSALVAVVMEVIHMTVLLLTHLTDAQQAIAIIKTVTVPMVIANTFATGISAFLLAVLARSFHAGTRRKLTLAEKIQQWLLLAVVVAYLVTTVFVYVLHTNTAKYSAQNIMEVTAEDVVKDIQEKADSEMLSLTSVLANTYATEGKNNGKLQEYAAEYGFQEINIVSEEGIITASTEPKNVGYDLNSREDGKEFLELNLYTFRSYVQEFGVNSYGAGDKEELRKYAAVVLRPDGFLQTGYSYEGLKDRLDHVIEGIAKNHRIGTDGYILISDDEGFMISDRSGESSKLLSDTGLDLTGQDTDVFFDADVYGERSLCLYGKAEGYRLITVMPYEEINRDRDTNVYLNSFMEVLTFAVLFAIVYYLIKFIVVNDIRFINGVLEKIIGGDPKQRIRRESTLEMEELTGYINRTVETLNRYIKEAEERMKKDLELAKDIQHSALPSVFPPYPEISQFDIFATMNTAREVGGDFYDFFLLGDHRLAFVIADVSGKGIPAAMFMMRAKTLIKSLTATGKDAASVITEVNNQLCQDNDAGMFVTAWFGILDYHTGHIIYVNAGHNPPLVGRKGEGYSYLKSRAGLVLAGMEGVPYRTQELELGAGDRLFLYTDGVTEATSTDTELYGEERLLAWMNGHQDLPIREIPDGVQADIDAFIKGADQFDDITMLVLEYKG